MREEKCSNYQRKAYPGDQRSENKISNLNLSVHVERKVPKYEVSDAIFVVCSHTFALF